MMLGHGQLAIVAHLAVHEDAGLPLVLAVAAADTHEAARPLPVVGRLLAREPGMARGWQWLCPTQHLQPPPKSAALILPSMEHAS